MSESSPEGEVRVEIDAVTRVGTIVMSRPARRNALTVEMCGRLTGTLRDVGADPAVRAVLLTGEPPAFCAGADFGDFDSGPDRGGFVPAFHDLLGTIAHLRVPVVAWVNGAALGAGCQIVCQCDLRVAAPSAPIGIPAAKVGIVLDMPNTVRLVGEIGPFAARRLLLTGEPVSGDEALRLGIVNRLADDDGAEARQWAGLMAGRAPLSVQGHKASVQAIVDAGHLDPAAESFLAGHERSMEAFASEDIREGLSAFGEKRRPEFHGR